jgi:hypothetical protein
MCTTVWSTAVRRTGDLLRPAVLHLPGHRVLLQCVSVHVCAAVVQNECHIRGCGHTGVCVQDVREPVAGKPSQVGSASKQYWSTTTAGSFLWVLCVFDGYVFYFGPFGQIAMPWMQLGFVNLLEMDQVLMLWDRLIGNRKIMHVCRRDLCKIMWCFVRIQ